MQMRATGGASLPADAAPGISAADVSDVHGFVARRIGNSEDAKDVAQQTLLLACTKLDTCRAQSRRAWLFMIARNLIVDHYRTRGRFRFVEAAELAETERGLRTADDAVHAQCERRELLRCWLECVTKRLPLKEQIALLLSEMYGYRDKDSARMLGLSLPSFKFLLHRARSRLQWCSEGCSKATTLPLAPCHGEPPELREARTEFANPRGEQADLLALRQELLADLELF